MWFGRCIGILLIGLVAGLGGVAWPCSPARGHQGSGAAAFADHETLHVLREEREGWVWAAKPVPWEAPEDEVARFDGSLFDTVVAIRVLNDDALLVVEKVSAPDVTGVELPSQVALWVLQPSGAQLIGGAPIVTTNPERRPLVSAERRADGTTMIAYAQTGDTEAVVFLRYSPSTGAVVEHARSEVGGCADFAFVPSHDGALWLLCPSGLLEFSAGAWTQVMSFPAEAGIAPFAAASDRAGGHVFFVYAYAARAIQRIAVGASGEVTNAELLRFALEGPFHGAAIDADNFVLSSHGETSAYVVLPDGLAHRMSPMFSEHFTSDLEVSFIGGTRRYRVGGTVFDRHDVGSAWNVGGANVWSVWPSRFTDCEGTSCASTRSGSSVSAFLSLLGVLIAAKQRQARVARHAPVDTTPATRAR